jgi:hypothetical protein
MKLGSIITTVVMVGFLNGCSQSVPTCSDTETTNLVLEIANNKVAEIYGPEAAAKIKLGIEAIRTTDTHDKTGANTCAANMSMLKETGQTSFPITYTVEMTDNGEEFYVNVFGL